MSVHTTPVERMGGGDLMTLASDLGDPPMQIAGILVLDGGSALNADVVAATVAERANGIRRFRQHLVRAPFGLGNPYWADDPGFAIHRHFLHVRCPAPGDDEALLDIATTAVTRKLPRDRPLWSVTFVTGLAGGDAALVFVMHHVLTDGIGGLAALARMADGTPAEADPAFLVPKPGAAALFADANRRRIETLRTLPAGARRLRRGLRELRQAGITLAPRSSLNQPTGPCRRFAVARADLRAVRATAREHGGLLNDAVLTAATGALRTLLDARGEEAGSLVVSVPVSTRSRDPGARLGNHAVAVPVELPSGGRTVDRLAAIALLTRGRFGSARGASVALVGPFFRGIARLNLLRWLVDHQRMLSTSVTYLRGPSARLAFLGTPISEVIPLSTVKGNMTVSFVALSYGGRLTVTAVTDPGRVRDLPVLMAGLRDELAALSAPRGTGGGEKPSTMRIPDSPAVASWGSGGEPGRDGTRRERP
ncbi:wax ester/triacylglycerol synthase domain-containing protein [Saccharomonospora sp. NPDC006951]